MENDFRTRERVNGFDFNNLIEGGKAEIEDAILFWEQNGKKELTPEYGEDEVSLMPYNCNGNLSFRAYVYEASMKEMKKWKEGVLSDPRVIMVDFYGLNEDFGFVEGNYEVHTSIPFGEN